MFIAIDLLLSVLCSDLRDNIEQAASAYSNAAGLILCNDFTLLEVGILHILVVHIQPSQVYSTPTVICNVGL